MKQPLIDNKKKTNPQIAQDIIDYLDSLHPILERPEVISSIKRHYRTHFVPCNKQQYCNEYRQSE